MIRFARGLALSLLAACGEQPPPGTPADAGKPASKAGDLSLSPSPAANEAADAAPAEGRKKKIDKKGRSKSPELFRKYMALMEDNGDLLQAIEADVEAKKGDAVIKPKVLKIIKNAVAARALHYRKDPEEDAKLDTDFELFLMKMEKIGKAAWDADGGKDLFENLSGRCTVCHDTFQ